MASLKVGVVLFQLGGPDSVEAIEPFLYNLFSDPDIIDFPFARVARQPLARLIAARRAAHVAHHYAAIGGRSPIREFTERQAVALERELRERGVDARVTIAMRYSNPLTAAAVAEVEQWRPEELVLLPLYPQYSKTTTGSAFNEWNRRFRPQGRRPRIHRIEDYHDEPAYLESVCALIDQWAARIPDPEQVDMVFSAHSVPQAVIDSGDPYQRQVERTVELVCRLGGWPVRRHICYQSKVGASKWLRPSLDETIKKLAGARHVLVVPISFVSDHVETLFEIDIEQREQARALGIRDFHMVAGLNDTPKFVAALAGLVEAQLATPRGAPRDRTAAPPAPDPGLRERTRAAAPARRS